MDLPTTIAAVAEWLDSFGTPVPLIGYSQGGRIALLTALERPDLVARLILISTSPGIAGIQERRRRRESDRALAAHIEEIGVERFLDEWLAGPIVAAGHLDEATQRADREIRLENTATGLAAAVRGFGQGSQPYVGDRLTELAVPILTISGRLDTNYQAHAEAMASAARDGRHVSVDDSGHNVVRDAPSELLSIITAFSHE